MRPVLRAGSGQTKLQDGWKMVRATHPDVNEGYTAMKTALRKNPRMLYAMLNSHRQDLEEDFHAAMEAEDANAANEVAANIERVDNALERLEDKFKLRAQDAPEPQTPAVMGEDDDQQEEAPATERAPVPKAIGLGFKRPDPEELSDEERAENPVAMNGRLRREMGHGAANWMDDYAKAIYDKALEFFNDIKAKALSLQNAMEMGEEDPTDGETSLREMLLVEVGRRGVADIEPHFDDWRNSVIKQIVKDVKDMFEPPATEIELEDDQIGTLLGLDALDEELAAEEADNAEAEAEEEPEEPEEEAPEDEDEAEEPEAEEEPEEAVEAALDRPFKVARGPVSMTIGQPKKPVSASMAVPEPRTASDFVPSGYTTPRLE